MGQVRDVLLQALQLHRGVGPDGKRFGPFSLDPVQQRRGRRSVSSAPLAVAPEVSIAVHDERTAVPREHLSLDHLHDVPPRGEPAPDIFAGANGTPIDRRIAE